MKRFFMISGENRNMCNGKISLRDTFRSYIGDCLCNRVG